MIDKRIRIEKLSIKIEIEEIRDAMTFVQYFLIYVGSGKSKEKEKNF